MIKINQNTGLAFGRKDVASGASTLHQVLTRLTGPVVDVQHHSQGTQTIIGLGKLGKKIRTLVIVIVPADKRR